MEYNDAEIEKLIKDGVSYEEIGRMYGVTGSSIKKHAKKVGITLPCRRKKNITEKFNKGVALKGIKHCQNCGKEMLSSSQKKFCSSECFQEYMFKTRVEDWKNNPEKYDKEYTPSFIRKYMFLKVGCKCEKCGWSEKNEFTGNIPLEIHHKDGDCTNNKEENLMVLCPNHHSLTKNFGSLNNGKSKRYSLKLYKERFKGK